MFQSVRCVDRVGGGGGRGWGEDGRANRPHSIQYSNMARRLTGQHCKFFNFFLIISYYFFLINFFLIILSLNSQRRLGYKENNTKFDLKASEPC